MTTNLMREFEDFIRRKLYEDCLTIDWNVKNQKKGEEKKRSYTSSFTQRMWFVGGYDLVVYRTDPILFKSLKG